MKYKALSIILALLIIAPMLSTMHLANAVPAEDWYIINPGPASYPSRWTAGPDVADQGTSNFNFTTTDSPGHTVQYDTFFVNITIANVANMKSWGIGLIFDNTTMKYVKAWRPTDHVFAAVEAAGNSMQAPGVVLADYDATHQEVQWGCAYIMPDPPMWFDGTGVACQIQFNITASVGILHPLVEADFSIDPAWSAVYFYPSGNEVPTLHTGHFKYEFLYPTAKPDFYVLPPSQTATKVGDDVPFSVWVTNVDPGWEIIGFQFSLWYNTSLLNGTTFYQVGSWMNNFATMGNGESVMYAAYNDFIGIDPELPPNYNKWFCGIILVPGGSGYSAPFPGAAPGGPTGVLFTLHMQAVSETIFPEVDSTLLTIHDVLVYNQYGMKIATSDSTNGTFIAPQKILGLSVDLYSCRDGVLQDNGLWIVPKYQGAGQGVPTDMYQPQAEVDLQANLTYNGWPVQQKLAGFEIHAPDGSSIPIIYRENYTDFDGTAWIKFRIPWPCVDPWVDIFGVWTAIVTVEVAKQIVNDTIQFKVGWPVQVLNVTGQDVTISKTQPTPMKFTVWYSTQRMDTSDIPLLLTVAAYDNLGFFIGGAAKTGMLSDYTGGDLQWCTTVYFSETFDIPTPTNAVVGPATVYANAFNYAPWVGGVPWSPEATGTFQIKTP